MGIFSFSLSPRVTLTLFSRVFFLPVLTFIQIYHWFSEVRFTGFKSQSHFGPIGYATLGNYLTSLNLSFPICKVTPPPLPLLHRIVERV